MDRISNILENRLFLNIKNASGLRVSPQILKLELNHGSEYQPSSVFYKAYVCNTQTSIRQMGSKDISIVGIESISIDPKIIKDKPKSIPKILESLKNLILKKSEDMGHSGIFVNTYSKNKNSIGAEYFKEFMQFFNFRRIPANCDAIPGNPKVYIFDGK